MKRQGNKIMAWLVERRISASEIGRKAGITQSIMSETIHGRRNNRRALRALVDIGCPVKLLDLPEDMKGKEAA